MNQDRLKKYIRLVIEDYIRETSTTSGAPGYNSPHAFRGNTEKFKKKIRRIAGLLGMRIVEPLPTADPIGSGDGSGDGSGGGASENKHLVRKKL